MVHLLQGEYQNNITATAAFRIRAVAMDILSEFLSRCRYYC
jgi:hypothetical protein